MDAVVTLIMINTLSYVLAYYSGNFDFEIKSNNVSDNFIVLIVHAIICITFWQAFLILTLIGYFMKNK